MSEPIIRALDAFDKASTFDDHPLAVWDLASALKGKPSDVR